MPNLPPEMCHIIYNIHTHIKRLGWLIVQVFWRNEDKEKKDLLLTSNVITKLAMYYLITYYYYYNFVVWDPAPPRPPRQLKNLDLWYEMSHWINRIIA